MRIFTQIARERESACTRIKPLGARKASSVFVFNHLYNLHDIWLYRKRRWVCIHTLAVSACCIFLVLDTAILS